MKKILYILFSICLFTACSSDDPISDDGGDNGNSGGGSSDLTIEKAKSLIVGTWSLSNIKIEGIDILAPNSDYQETMVFDANKVSITTYNKDNQETSKNTYPYSFSVKSDIYRITVTYDSEKSCVLLLDYLREKDMRTYTNDDSKIKTWQKK